MTEEATTEEVETNPMQRTVSLFKHVKYEYVIVSEHDAWNDDADYVRITEPQQLLFIEREAAELVPDQVQCLKKLQENVRIKAQVELEGIEERIQKLMAITAQ